MLTHLTKLQLNIIRSNVDTQEYFFIPFFILNTDKYGSLSSEVRSTYMYVFNHLLSNHLFDNEIVYTIYPLKDLSSDRKICIIALIKNV